MFLVNSRLGLFSAASFEAPLIPKLRGYFAEFLNNASSVGLRILSSSTCVGLWYGYVVHDSGFSRHTARMLRYLDFAPRLPLGLQGRFANLTPPGIAPVFALPAHALYMRPHISDTT